MCSARFEYGGEPAPILEPGIPSAAQRAQALAADAPTACRAGVDARSGVGMSCVRKTLRRAHVSGEYLHEGVEEGREPRRSRSPEPPDETLASECSALIQRDEPGTLLKGSRFTTRRLALRASSGNHRRSEVPIQFIRDTTKHRRVSLNSLPRVGSSRTRCTSPRNTGKAGVTTSSPPRRIASWFHQEPVVITRPHGLRRLCPPNIRPCATRTTSRPRSVWSSTSSRGRPPRAGSSEHGSRRSCRFGLCVFSSACDHIVNHRR